MKKQILDINYICHNQHGSVISYHTPSYLENSYNAFISIQRKFVTDEVWHEIDKMPCVLDSLNTIQIPDSSPSSYVRVVLYWRVLEN